MTTFTPISKADITSNPATIMAALLPVPVTGLTYDVDTLNVINGTSSLGFYDGSLTALGIGAGLLLTSGTMPGASNTVGYFGVSNNMPGDPALDAVVNTVFNTQSLDATTLSFSFTVTDPTITGVSFNIVFGSDEYPEWVNQFVDIGVVLVNGVNVALFNHNPMAPLSVIGSNLASGYFINNLDGHLPIEYDGVSAPMTVFAPVHMGVNTLMIGVADTRDHIYDSGLFISGMTGTTVPVSGITLDMDGSELEDDMQGTEASESVESLGGNDTINAEGGDDIIQAGAGDDKVNAGTGNNYLDGGDGIDTAIYAGLAADYSIVGYTDGTVKVKQLSGGLNASSDLLVNVESAQFADVTIDLSTVPMTATPEAPLIGASTYVSPVVASATTSFVGGAANEDGDSVTINLLENATGGENAVTDIVSNLADLPAGVTFDAGTNTLTLDPGNSAYQDLSAGETQTVTVNYGITNSTDGIASTTTASATFTITGINDAPVVSEPATFSVQEDLGVESVAPISGEVEVEVVETEIELELKDLAEKDSLASGNLPNAINLLSKAMDVDHLDSLAVVDVPAVLPSGVKYIHLDAQTIPSTLYYGAPTVIPAIDALVIDPSDASFQSLAKDEKMTVSIGYGISDGMVTTPTAAIFTITGANDAPLVSGLLSAAPADEGGVSVAVDALALASDADHGAVLSLTAAPPGNAEDFSGLTEVENPADDTISAMVISANYDGTTASLPPGVSFDAETNRFILDPSDLVYDHLSANEVGRVVINYGITDGIVPVATSATALFTIVGANDAPVVSGAVTYTVQEGNVAAISGSSGFDPLEIEALEDHGVSAAQIPNSVNLLTDASDVDHLDTLSVTALPPVLANGITYIHTAAYSSPTGYYGAMVEHPTVDVLMIDPSDASFQKLAEGEELAITINYEVSDGIVTTPAQAVFTVLGTNDAPLVSGAVTASADEDDAIVTIDALANAADIDNGNVLTVTGAPMTAAAADEVSGPYYGGLKVQDSNGGTGGISADDPASDPALTVLPVGPVFDFSSLPAGVTFDSVTNSFSLVPSDAAYQHLSAGQVQTVTVNYGITDGIATTAASATFTVTGTNDAPKVTGSPAFSASEDALAQVINPLANASDIDMQDVLGVVGALPEGIHLTTVPGGYYQPDITVTTFNPGDAVFQSLAQGEAKTVTWNYQVTDGLASTESSAIFIITGINDAPVIAVPVSATMDEDSALVTVDALANATDIDNGAVLSVVNVPAILPAGISYDAVNHSFTIDPGYPVFQELAQGETHAYSVTYGVSDGMVTTMTAVNFYVVGVNDAPIVSGPVTGSPNEDGQTVSVNATGNAIDVDDHQGLQVTGVPSELPAGVSFDEATGRFSLDPTDTAYQYLSKGETLDVVVGYDVFDGYVNVPTSVIFSITGKDDAPTVSGAVQGGNVSENAAAFTIDLLANTTDADHLDVLNVKLGQGAVITTSATGPWSAPINFSVANNHLTIDPAQFNALRADETLDISFNYTVTDGSNQGGDAAASAQVIITGANDAPVSMALSSAHITENSAAGVNVGQLTTVDADQNETFTYQILNDPRGFFTIIGGKLAVAAGAVIDYETIKSDTIQIQVTDSTGASIIQSFTIAIDNVSGVVIAGSSKDDVYNATSAIATTNEEDTVDGKNGNDTLSGLAGNDMLNGGAGNDIIDAGDGDDTIIFSGSDAQGDTINVGSTGEVNGDTALIQGNKAVTLTNFSAGLSSIENWLGNGLNIVGTGSADKIDLSYLKSLTGLSFIDGGSGNDIITGSAFADDLRGNAGDDSINGGVGNDTLTGGSGIDTFVFNAGFGKDSISDFASGSGKGHDIIDLDHTLFPSFSAVQTGMSQVGANMVITSSVGAITLVGVSMANVVAADFAFH